MKVDNMYFYNRYQLHIIYSILEYIILTEPTYFGHWNLLLAAFWGLSPFFIRSKQNSPIRDPRNKVLTKYATAQNNSFITTISLILDILGYIFIIYLLFTSSEEKLGLFLACPYFWMSILYCLQKTSHKIIFLIVNSSMLIYILQNYSLIPQQPIIILFILFSHISLIYYIYFSIQNIEILEAKGKLDKEITKQDILNQMPISLAIYDQINNSCIMNTALEKHLEKIGSLTFDEFARKLYILHTDISLMQEISTKIAYFSSHEVILKNITESNTEFYLKSHFTELSKKIPKLDGNVSVYDIKFCKIKLKAKSSILIIVTEMNNENLQKDKKIANRYKNMISKTMCHDLKSPLNGIIGPLEDFPIELKSHESYQIMLMNAYFLQYKIDDMLDYSLIELDEFKQRNQAFSLKKLLNNMKDLCQTQIELSNLKVKIVMGRTVPNIFFSDKPRIKQILLHLIQNAIKYTKDTKTNLITIYIERISPTSLEFGVKDTGIGMTAIIKENIEFLITHGIRNKMTTNTYNPTEMGLGLSITAKICKAIGSKLKFQSFENIGSKFYFQISSKLYATTKVIDRNEFSGEIIKSVTEKEKWRKKSIEPKISAINLSDLSAHLKEEHPNITFGTYKKAETKTKEIKTTEKITLQDCMAELDALFEVKVPESNMKETFSNIESRESCEVYDLDEFAERANVANTPKYKTKVNLDKFTRRKMYTQEVKIEEPIQLSIHSDQETSPKANTKLNKFKTMAKIDSPLMRIGSSEKYLYEEKSKFHALVVDDMPSNRFVLKGLLKRLNLSTEEANDGKVAVEMCEERLRKSIYNEKPFDIIFMDVDMPIMDGITATKILIKMLSECSWERKIPIIGVTAYDTPEMKADCLKAGMSHFLPKPVKLGVLKNIVNSYLIVANN